MSASMTPALRTLTVAQAMAQTGLSRDRLMRAIKRGEIAVFQESQSTDRKRGPGRKRGASTLFILQSSLESWFYARVSGGDRDEQQRAAQAGAAAISHALDVDDDILADIPVDQRRFS
jgi:hypothetical protein